MSKFVTAVQVPHPDGSHVGFLPGDEVPEWALKVVGAHVYADSRSDTGVEDKESTSQEEEESTGSESDTGVDFTKPAPAKRGRPRKAE